MQNICLPISINELFIPILRQSGQKFFTAHRGRPQPVIQVMNIEITGLLLVCGLRGLGIDLHLSGPLF